jgi:hypothetical protein
VRYAHFGEGGYDKTESAIRALLAEAGHSRLGATAHARVETASPGLATPETYVGYKRSQGFEPPVRPGLGRYAASDQLAPVHFALDGTWDVKSESATAVSGASIHARVTARRVFLVLGTADDRPRLGHVLLDGKPIPDAQAGSDVAGGRLLVGQQRLYRLVNLPRVEDRTLTIELAPGTTAYAFTFG